MRTWPAGHANNQGDMHARFMASNPPPPKREHFTVTPLVNAWHCRDLGWTYSFVKADPPEDRHPSWVKMRHVLAAWDSFEEGRPVLVLDTDAWIRDAPGLAHLLRTRLDPATGKLMLGAGEPVVEETSRHGADVLNGGFLCFLPDPRVRELFQHVWDLGSGPYARDWPWEQACLGRAFRDNVAGCRDWCEILSVPMCNTPAGTHVAHCWYKDLATDLAVSDLLGALAQTVFDLRRPTVELVVARHLEDVAWVNEWVPYVDRVTIYDKSGSPVESVHPKITVVPLPNVGREAHTYAHHFAEHYDDLCDRVVCTQGSYSPHMSRESFEAIVRGGQPPTLIPTLDTSWSLSLMAKFGWTQDSNYVAERMQPSGMTMGKFFLRYIADDLLPEDKVGWWANAIFAAPRDAVRRHPRAKYGAIRELCEVGPNPEAAHMLERGWKALLA